MLQVHERTKDMDDRKVVVAITSSNKTGRIYTAFGEAKDEFNDAEYINVFGYITYDKETHEYKAASMEKLQDPSAPGNIMNAAVAQLSMSIRPDTNRTISFG